jgi:hypothetical protein
LISTDGETAGRLDGDQVCISRAQLDLAAEDD